MAGLRPNASLVIGSSPWISNERQLASHFIAQDMEDFAFSARNEMDWLNEHMADVFNENQMNITDMLKTPGKLRGKTPRTIRKRNPMENRAPLTDIFTTDNNQPQPNLTRAADLQKPTVAFMVAEDPVEDQAPSEPEKSMKHGKVYNDSGYHGTTEDEMDVDSQPEHQHPPGQKPNVAPHHVESAAMEPGPDTAMDIDHISTSAEEPQRASPQAMRKIQQTESWSEDAKELASGTTMSGARGDSADVVPVTQSPPRAGQRQAKDFKNRSPEQMVQNSPILSLVAAQSARSSPEAPPNETDARSPSDASSPVQPLLRKSSLNFASLPAREPLATKKSIGARNSRTSHLEQSKGNGPNRGSYFSRHTGGKSIGSFPQDESDQSDEDDEGTDRTKGLTGDESDGDSRTTKLHHKTSTQRLQGKINMLAQSQPPRPNRPATSSAVVNDSLKYPDLPAASTVVDQSRAGLQGKDPSPGRGDDDEDDWIPLKPGLTTESALRPQLVKSHSADVMEQISGKGHIGSMETDIAATEPYASHELLSKQPARGMPPKAASIHTKSASTTTMASPERSIGDLQPGLSKQGSVSNPDLAAALRESQQGQSSTTPVGSPSGKRYADGPLSASKAKLSSLLKSARGIFASSAGVSAQAKMETMSPSSRARLRADSPPKLERPSYQNRSHPYEHARKRSITRPLPEPPVARDPTNSPPKETIRKTRSSTEKEAKNREKENQDRRQNDQDAEKTQEKERQKAAVFKQERDKVIAAGKQRYAAAASTQTQPKGAEAKKPTEDDYLMTQEVQEAPQESTVREAQSSTLSGQSRAPAQEIAQSQKNKEPRRPLKPSKDTMPKMKPAPVSIRVDTVSQWGLDHRKIAQPSTNGPTENQQEDPAASTAAPVVKQAGLPKKPSNASLQSANSVNTGKAGPSNATGRPRALLTAERKKEQDERETQRKLELRRENERKRAAQQEEDRRQEQKQKREAERQRTEDRATAAEEQRKAAQRQALEKRRLELAKRAEQSKAQAQPARVRPVNDNQIRPVPQEKPQGAPLVQRGELGTARPPSRMNSTANVRTAHEDFNRSVKQPQINPAKPPKRVLQNDGTERGTNRPPPPSQPANKGGAAYQQNEHKRRKTNEDEVEVVEARQAMPPPPIRPSNMNGGPSKALFPTGYANASHNASNHMAPSLFNPPSSASNYPQHPKTAHPMAMATYTSGKIPFAEGQGNKAIAPPPSQKTPGNKTPASNAKSSPRYPNGDAIELPEIATDSEDEDEENEFVVPEWARSPNLDPSLLGQQLWNPEEVFGPPNPTLHVEEIFTSKDRHHRFRARTSSANWNGQDRLTQDEIEKDIEARGKLIANGGWTYGL